MIDEKSYTIPDNPVALARITAALDASYGFSSLHLTDLAPRLYRKIYLRSVLGLEDYRLQKQECINLIWMWYSGGGVAESTFNRILAALDLDWED